MLDIKSYSFIKCEDIPKDGAMRMLLTAQYPLHVISQLYRNCINDINGKPLLVLSNDVTVPWYSTSEALSKFAPFNLLTDLEKAVQKNAARGIFHPVRPGHIPDDYITAVCNKYFRWRRSQFDCLNVLTAFRGELAVLCSDFNIDNTIEHLFDMRVKRIERHLYIFKESEWLKHIKDEFRKFYFQLSHVLYTLQNEFCEVPEDDTIDFEL